MIFELSNQPDHGRDQLNPANANGVIWCEVCKQDYPCIGDEVCPNVHTNIVVNELHSTTGGE